jgi:hypothetical protein
MEGEKIEGGAWNGNGGGKEGMGREKRSEEGGSGVRRTKNAPLPSRKE